MFQSYFNSFILIGIIITILMNVKNIVSDGRMDDTLIMDRIYKMKQTLLPSLYAVKGRCSPQDQI